MCLCLTITLPTAKVKSPTNNIVVYDCIDVSDSLPAVLRIVRGVYGDRALLEKTLKNTAGLQQERVRVFILSWACLFS